MSLCSSHLRVEIQEGSGEQEIDVGKDVEEC